MAAVVLMLEDDLDRLVRFHAVATGLGVDLISWPNAHRMIAEMGQFFPAALLISFDHDLEPDGPTDPGDGLDVVRHLTAHAAPFCPVIVHTSNRARGDMMMGELELASWEHHRVPPIGDDWIEVDWRWLVRVLLRAHRPSG